MAVDFETCDGRTIKRTAGYWLFTHEIDIDAKNNGRATLPDIQWIKDSISHDGQWMPCVVRKNGKRALMVEGHSRWRAICELNEGRAPEDQLKVWVTYFDGNEIDALMAGFAMNRERNSLTPIDEGYFVARMQRFGKSLEDIAAIVHEDVKWCSDRLAFVSLTPEAQTAVIDGTIKKLSAAVELSKLAAADQRRYLESHTGEKITAGGIRASVTPAKPPKPTLKTLADILRSVVDDGKYPAGFERIDSADSVGDSLAAFCTALLAVIGEKK